MNSIALHVEEGQRVGLHVADGALIDLDVGGSMYAVGPPIYRGSYEVTPTQQAQILETEGRQATENIVVNPIPNNYGLITWDGSKLRVS